MSGEQKIKKKKQFPSHKWKQFKRCKQQERIEDEEEERKKTQTGQNKVIINNVQQNTCCQCIVKPWMNEWLTHIAIATVMNI